MKKLVMLLMLCAAPAWAQNYGANWDGPWISYGISADVNNVTEFETYQAVVNGTASGNSCNLKDSSATGYITPNAIVVDATSSTAATVENNADYQFIIPFANNAVSNCRLAPVPAGWTWSNANITTVTTVNDGVTCTGSQKRLSLSGSGQLYLTNSGNGCNLNTGNYYNTSISFSLSSGSYACGATWPETWATFAQGGSNVGPTYSQQGSLHVKWNSINYSYAPFDYSGPIATIGTGQVGAPAPSGQSVIFLPFTPTSFTAGTGLSTAPSSYSLGDFSPAPPAFTVCDDPVIFYPQSAGAVTRSMGAGAIGTISFTRSGYILCKYFGTQTRYSATETY